jgi:hypothetical protein
MWGWSWGYFWAPTSSFICLELHLCRRHSLLILGSATHREKFSVHSDLGKRNRHESFIDVCFDFWTSAHDGKWWKKISRSCILVSLKQSWMIVITLALLWIMSVSIFNSVVLWTRSIWPP